MEEEKGLKERLGKDGVGSGGNGWETRSHISAF